MPIQNDQDQLQDQDRVHELISQREIPELARFVRTLSVSDAAQLIDALPTDGAAVVFRLLEKQTAIAVFEELDSGIQADLVTEFGQVQIADVFGSLEPETQAWLFEELPAKVAKRILEALHGDELDEAMVLLGYRSGSIARRMSPTEITTTPHEPLSQLRRRVEASDLPTPLVCEIPVLGVNRELVGVIGLAEAMTDAGADARVDERMDASPVTAVTEDDAEQVARRALDGGVLVTPIVDSENRLVGILPINDAARIDRNAVAEDQAMAGAREPLRRPYLFTSIPRIARSRIVWLLVLAISGVFTVQVLDMFEQTLAQKIALTLFVPLLIGIGGNTGSQAATTVTRALAVGDLGLRDAGRVALKEAGTGVLLGTALGVLAVLMASPFYGLDIGIVLGVTLIVNCPLAATVGGVIPLVARACRIDPAVFSTPFISTFCDATGLLVYFTVAVTLLGL